MDRRRQYAPLAQRSVAINASTTPAAHHGEPRQVPVASDDRAKGERSELYSLRHGPRPSVTESRQTVPGLPISWARNPRVPGGSVSSSHIGPGPGLDRQLEAQEWPALAFELDELSQQVQRALFGAVPQGLSLRQPAGPMPMSRQIGEEAGAALCQVGLAQRAGDWNLCPVGHVLFPPARFYAGCETG